MHTIIINTLRSEDDVLFLTKRVLFVERDYVFTFLLMYVVAQTLMLQWPHCVQGVRDKLRQDFKGHDLDIFLHIFP
jgi:hypothetical protein